MAVAIVLASALFAAAQGVLPTPPGTTPTPVARLFNALASFVGNDAQECGRPAGDRQAALACAEEASGAHRPFRLYAERPGRAFAATGLIGTADGRTWRFTYDTSACTSSDCFGQLSVTRCVGPRVQSSPDDAAEWSCASEPAELIEPIPRFVTPEACRNTVSRTGPGPDLDAAWVRRFAARVRTVWVVPAEAYATRGRVDVEFDVLRDGTIADIVVTTRVSAALDGAAVRALQAASPVAPLPESYPEAKAHVSSSFCYND